MSCEICSKTKNKIILKGEGKKKLTCNVPLKVCNILLHLIGRRKKSVFNF